MLDTCRILGQADPDLTAEEPPQLVHILQQLPVEGDCDYGLLDETLCMMSVSCNSLCLFVETGG